MTKRIVAGVLRQQGMVLICQRGRHQVQPLRWEFPGGKVEADEDERTALIRELREELAIEIRVGRPLARVRHRYVETGELELIFFEVTEFAGEPTRQPGPMFEAVIWESPAQLGTYDFLPADRPVLELLQNLGGHAC